MWDVDTGHCRSVLCHGEPVSCFAFDDRHVVSGDYDGRIRVRRLEDDAHLFTLQVVPRSNMVTSHGTQSKELGFRSIQCLFDGMSRIGCRTNKKWFGKMSIHFRNGNFIDKLLFDSLAVGPMS